jgi:hypothetical protein
MRVTFSQLCVSRFPNRACHVFPTVRVTFSQPCVSRFPNRATREAEFNLSMCFPQIKPVEGSCPGSTGAVLRRDIDTSRGQYHTPKNMQNGAVRHML